MSLFRINKVESDLKKLQSDMSSLMRSLEDVLIPQVNELAARVAQTPQPLRARWERHSAPAWERETVLLPSVSVRKLTERISSKLALLPPPQSRINRVTICMHGREQFVNAYDADDQRIPYFCGPFREVGLKVLEAAGSLVWEEVFESA